MSTIMPWFKWFPADSRADPQLHACSLASRAVWMEMLGLMWEARDNARLTLRRGSGGDAKPIDETMLARLIAAGVDDVVAAQNELESAGVFSRDPDGVIYSRRMRRDITTHEENRENGRKGGNPALRATNGRVGRRPVNPRLKPQRPEARSQKPEARVARDEKSRCQNTEEY